MYRKTGAFSVDATDAVDATETSGFNGSRLSATVILIRDTPDGIKVWMQERVMSMKNYPGMTVFPGGGVDSRDFPPRAWNDGDLWIGKSAVSVARRLGVTKYKAHALLFAAVRELFEETGTLLAVDDEGTLLGDARPFHDQRLKLVSHEISLTDMLQANELNVCSDLLIPFARWVGCSHRGNWFDTFSFLAKAPIGQEPDAETGEADDANWFSPKLLMEGWRAGLVRFVPSTWGQLQLLCSCDTFEDAVKLARNADMRPIIGDPADDPRYHEFFHQHPTDRIGTPK